MSFFVDSAGAQVPTVFAAIRYVIARYVCHCKTLHNALDPNLMTPAERLAEIGEILAAGLIRLRARQRETLVRRSGESSFDFPAHQSVHGQKRRTRERP